MHAIEAGRGARHGARLLARVSYAATISERPWFTSWAHTADEAESDLAPELAGDGNLADGCESRSLDNGDDCPPIAVR